MNYYNPNVAMWEPLLEHWKPQLLLQFPMNAGCRVLLKSQERLNINITRQFFETITNTLSFWKADYYNSVQFPYKIALHSFILRNETGQKLRYWLNNSVRIFCSLFTKYRKDIKK
jgi:hypothetical protein